MLLNYKINRLDVGIFFVFIQNIIYFLYLYSRNESFLVLYFSFIIILLPLIVFYKKYISYYILFIITLALFILSSFFSKEYEVKIGLYNLLYLFCSLIASYFIVNSKKSLFYMLLTFYIYSIFLSYFILKFGADGEAYNTILNGSSRNYLSAISIFLTITIYLVLYFRKKLFLFHPAIINFIICLCLFGRSGIILSLLILLFVVYTRSVKVFVYSSLISIAFMSFFIFQFEAFIFERSNFSIGLESVRSTFRHEYMTGIFSSNEFITGRKLANCCSYIQFYDSNPHNSFIMGHIRYGVFHTLFSILLFMFILLSRNVILIFFTAIIYSRYFLDQMGLFAFFDFTLFSIVLICLLKKTGI